MSFRFLELLIMLLFEDSMDFKNLSSESYMSIPHTLKNTQVDNERSGQIIGAAIEVKDGICRLINSG